MTSELWRGGWRWPGPVPVLTLAATGIALAAAVCQYAIGGMVQALERAPGGLPDGQWWRLVTPVLVQTDGWYQIVSNLVTLVLLGIAAEWLLGRRWWLALIAAGTVGGQAAAYAWQVWGGGSSIAICGLAGGIVIAQLAQRARPSRVGAGTAIYYIAVLTGWGLGGVGLAELAAVAAAIAWHVPRLAWPASAATAERIVLAATIPCAVVLITQRSLHGAALLSAMFLTAAIRLLILPRHGAERRSSTTKPSEDLPPEVRQVWRGSGVALDGVREVPEVALSERLPAIDRHHGEVGEDPP